METQKTSPSPYLTLVPRTEAEGRIQREWRREQALRQGGLDAMEWAKNLFAVAGRPL